MRDRRHSGQRLVCPFPPAVPGWLAAIVLCLAAVLFAPSLAFAGGSVREEIKTYAIDGTTGPELYASIGERGPKIGAVRVIAHTSFKLTWRRDYRPDKDGCVLAGAVPKLVITTVLPKPRQKLEGAIAAKWQRFIDGVVAHEKVHGDFARQLVAEIEAESIGLSAPDDPDCNKVRAALQARLKVISDRNQARNRDFDQAEFADGGAVHRLILALVNDP